MDALRTGQPARRSTHSRDGFTYSREWCRVIDEVCGHCGRAFAQALAATKASDGDLVVALELIADRASTLVGEDLEALRLLLVHGLVLVVAAELDPSDEPTDLATEACLARLGVRPATLALAVGPPEPTPRWQSGWQPGPSPLSEIDPAWPARRSA